MSDGKVHAEDCDNPDGNCGKIDVLTKVVDLQGDLDRSQRQRLAEIVRPLPGAAHPIGVDSHRHPHHLSSLLTAR